MAPSDPASSRRRWSWRDDPQVPPFPDDRPLIVFDGECVLCVANARFVLRHDRRHRFRLAAAQGDLGRALYRHFGLKADEEGTMLVLKDGRLLTEADAALAIGEGLGWPWRASGMARVFPRGLRNQAYGLLARNRFRLFGRREACWIPSPADRDRIL